MSPSRRELLRTCSTAMGLAVGSAGCLSSPQGSRSTSETARTTTGNDPTEETSRSTATTAPETTAAPPPEVREVDPAVPDRGVPRSPSIESDTHDPFRTFVVGERPEGPADRYETPHVWVWNLTGEPTTVELALESEDAPLLDVEAEFPAGAPLALVFRDRRTYELTVRVGDREETVAVEPDRFWCNATGTDVLVKPDGIDAETISTSMACTTTPGGS